MQVRKAATVAVVAVICIVVTLAYAVLQKRRRVPSSLAVIPDFETTSRMRDAVGQEVDWGTQRTQLKAKVFTNDSEELARIFRNDEGSVMCQGAAYYLHLRYLDAGYRSYLVGFQSEVLSHSMALVEIKRKDGSRALIVQDPSFNLSYVDSTGQPLSVFEIMSKLAQGNHKSVFILEGKPANVEFLRHPLDPDPVGPASCVRKLIGPSKANPELLVYRATMSITTCSKALLGKVDDYCSARGLQSSILYAIFDRPIYVYKGYPMNAPNKADADHVFNQLKEHYETLRAREANQRVHSDCKKTSFAPRPASSSP
jgi:hypothetical protein